MYLPGMGGNSTSGPSITTTGGSGDGTPGFAPGQGDFIPGDGPLLGGGSSDGSSDGEDDSADLGYTVPETPDRNDGDSNHNDGTGWFPTMPNTGPVVPGDSADGDWSPDGMERDGTDQSDPADRASPLPDRYSGAVDGSALDRIQDALSFGPEFGEWTGVDPNASGGGGGGGGNGGLLSGLWNAVLVFLGGSAASVVLLGIGGILLIMAVLRE